MSATTVIPGDTTKPRLAGPTCGFTATADGANALDLGSNASGHIDFADGQRIEFEGLERISW